MLIEHRRETESQGSFVCTEPCGDLGTRQSDLPFLSKFGAPSDPLSMTGCMRRDEDSHFEGTWLLCLAGIFPAESLRDLG